MPEAEMGFPGDKLTAYCGLHITPYNMFATLNTLKKEVLVFANFYSEYLPSMP